VQAQAPESPILTMKHGFHIVKKSSDPSGTQIKVRKTPLFEPFLYEKRSFYQDRLGTNIGKTETRGRCCFLQALVVTPNELVISLNQVRKRTSFAPFIYINASFCQARLGTNIGKALIQEMIKALNQKVVLHQPDGLRSVAPAPAGGARKHLTFF
jgi:hypothetical protein